ncbi:MAG: hypothetical protein NZL95_00675 [Chitinophagales bacterium]|nr:hypothetical protein [Chitinophagales bacterium]MDW8427053.1 hypothetical protein [Chitinophagales bacterium]
MKTFRLVLLACLPIWIGSSGCQRGKPMDEAAIMQRADSVFNAGKEAALQQAVQNCETNKATWIQQKTDSIYKAMAAAHGGM